MKRAAWTAPPGGGIIASDNRFVHEVPRIQRGRTRKTRRCWRRNQEEIVPSMHGTKFAAPASCRRFPRPAKTKTPAGCRRHGTSFESFLRDVATALDK